MEPGGTTSSNVIAENIAVFVNRAGEGGAGFEGSSGECGLGGLLIAAHAGLFKEPTYNSNKPSSTSLSN